MKHQTTTEVIDRSELSKDWKDGAHWGLRAGDSEDYLKGLPPIEVETKSPVWLEGAQHGMKVGSRIGQSIGFKNGWDAAWNRALGGALLCGMAVCMLVFISFLVGCGGGFTFGPPAVDPSDEPTTCSIGQHEWNRYHVGHSALSPVVVNYSSYTPDLEAWNALNTPITLRSKGKGFKITVLDSGDANSGWLGLAEVKIDREGHIAEGTVKMNRVLLQSYPPQVGKHVLCQEIGHVLGLDHQRGAYDSCMDDCQGNADWLGCLSSREGMTPNAHDAEQMRDIYAHVPGAENPPSPTCGGSAATYVVHEFSAKKTGSRQ